MIQRRYLIIGLAAALFTLLIYYLIAHHARSNAELTLYGNIEIRDVDLSFRVPGRLISLNVDEGARVHGGESVARLDPSTYQYNLTQVRGQLDAAKADFARLTKGLRTQEITQAKAQLDAQHALSDDLRAKLIRAEALRKQQYISAQDYDTARHQYEQSVANVAFAEQGYSLAKQGFRSEEIDQGLAHVHQLQGAMETAQQQLDDTNLLAPQSGIIQIRVKEVGSMVASGTPIFTLSLINPTVAQVYVDEPHLGVVRQGQKAEITTDSRPDKPYHGYVGFISPTSEFTPKSVQTPELRTDLVYRLRVIIDDADDGLHQGMPVTVKILRK
jgi:HlyD family secretion protein